MHALLYWPPSFWAAFLLSRYALGCINMRTLRVRAKAPAILAFAMLLSACAATSEPPELPYPAFVQTDEISDIFLAALPGVRAKEYTSDMRTRTSSNRIDIPRDWTGTTGGAPGKSLEIFVLEGELRFSDFELRAGGYAYVPPGSLGFRLESDNGARVLYFLDDVDNDSVIRSPLILDSGLLAWESMGPGVSVRELRKDPGSGARTWLLRIDPGASRAWESSSTMREGYLVAGHYQHSECFEGEAATSAYLPGGYFRRPANVVNGGPDAVALSPSIWFLREQDDGDTATFEGCAAQPGN